MNLKNPVCVSQVNIFFANMIRVPIDVFNTAFVSSDYCNTEYPKVVLRDYKKHLDIQEKDFLHTYWLLKQTFGKDVAYHIMKFHQVPKRPYRGYTWLHDDMIYYTKLKKMYDQRNQIYFTFLCMCIIMHFFIPILLGIVLFIIILEMHYDIGFIVLRFFDYHFIFFYKTLRQQFGLSKRNDKESR